MYLLLCFSSSSLAPPARNRGAGSQSLDESHSFPILKTPRSRKTNGHLPVPCHQRAASTPSQIDQEPPLIVHHKRYPSNIETSDMTPKKYSLDSCITNEKTPKRVSSSASDKSKRMYDDISLSQGSRTSSERSVMTAPESGSNIANNVRKVAPLPTPELLAELLKGSSERLATENHQLNLGSGSSPLPTAVLKCLVSFYIQITMFSINKTVYIFLFIFYFVPFVCLFNYLLDKYRKICKENSYL